MKYTEDPRKTITYFCGKVCRKEHKISLRGWRVWCDEAEYLGGAE